MNRCNAALIVDDHPLISEGVKHILEKSDLFSSIHIARNYYEAVRYIEQRSFDLYIIDIELPQSDGFVLIDQIRSQDFDSRIIVNTMHDELWTIRKLMELNINGIVLKSSDTSQLLAAVYAVMEGKQYQCSHFSRLCARINSKSDANQYNIQLTEKELEILKAIVNGDSTAVIAQKLFRSINTIETHRRRIMDKFDAKNMAELVAKAIRLGFIPMKE